MILQADPRARHQLRERKQALDRALEGLGQHGLVTAAGGSAEGEAPLLHLGEALRGQLESLLSRCKVGALRLSAGHEAARVSLNRGPAPSTVSHQRQLSLRRVQVQERLIRNKTLLDALEPAEQAARGLETLLAVLRRRIQLDKEALCQRQSKKTTQEKNQGRWWCEEEGVRQTWLEGSSKVEEPGRGSSDPSGCGLEVSAGCHLGPYQPSLQFGPGVGKTSPGRFRQASPAPTAASASQRSR
ncbi:hypothetical protein HPB51_024168 [Rhipicephalus microplus]|uniref:Uncharacterized protein n=1 Tax=Rhipicephalus microplus TaxID=6941 RepID=A0A9J6DDZ3_RHIMP|nr:hypothetical protein HPB51_024168 [Rhipicephalus microplus]